MISRRCFLLGLGGLVTSAFVSRANAHSLSTDGPLLLDSGRAEETLYLYKGFDLSEGSWATKWRVSLGPDRWPTPPPLPWHEFLRRSGYDLSRPADLNRALCNWRIGIEDLHQPMDQGAWEDTWEARESPQARAFTLLKELRLDVELNGPGKKAGRIRFTEGGGHPRSNECWVDLRDDVTASLLQASLIDHKLPILVKVGQAR
jgi:hypothetical protein